MLRLSNSAIDKYNMCPRLFKYHYIDKIRSNITTTALVFGSAIDNSIELMLTGVGLDECIETFTNELNSNFTRDIHIYNKDYDWNTLSQEDIEILNSMEDSREKELEYALRSLKGKGIILISKFYEEFLDRVSEVINCQTEVSIGNGKYSIIGYIDFILTLDDGTTYLIDLKTSSSSYSARKLNESAQLHLYDFALKLMKNRGEYEKDLPTEIAYLVLRKDFNTKGEVRDIQFLSRKPDPDVTDSVMAKFDTLIDSIEDGKFNKTTKKYNCTKQFGKKCDYYDICQGSSKLSEITHLVKKE